VILVDTSVWIDHLHVGDAVLGDFLDRGRVLGHSFVVGELALGNLKQRDIVFRALRRLPQATVASHEEVLQLVERQPLYGLGIGYIDAHLLAAVRLMGGAQLWTRDRRLQSAASQLGLAAYPRH
jgi:predicted nucleic acid-binding protein